MASEISEKKKNKTSASKKTVEKKPTSKVVSGKSSSKSSKANTTTKATKKPVSKSHVQKSTNASVSSNSNSSHNELANLAKFLSGESSMKKKQEQLEKTKREAILKQKKALNRQISEGNVTLKEDEILTDKELEALGMKEQRIIQKVKLYEWEAPVRVEFPFKKRSFMIIVAISLAFILYLAILEHYGLMFSIAALLFFIYVAGTTEPVRVKHTITTQGVDTIDKLYEWYMLKDFWFTKKNGQYMLVINTKLRMPGSLILLFEEDQKGAIFMLLQEKLLYKEIRKQGWMYRTTYGEYVPIESI